MGATAIIGGAAAVVGGGLSAYGASQAKPGKWKPITDFREQMYGYQQEYPTVFAMEKAFQPGYAAVGAQTTGQTLFGARGGKHWQWIPMIDKDGNFRMRGMYVRRPATPGLIDMAGQAQGPLEDMYYGAQGRYQDHTLGRMHALDPNTLGLYDALGSRAQEGLDLGGQLDPSVRREIQQAIRAGQADRGMGLGQSDLYEELLGMGSAAEERKRAREQFAMQVYGTRPNLGQMLWQNPTGGLGLQGVGAAYEMQRASGPRLGIDPFRSPGQHPPNNAGANAMAAGGAGLMQLGGNMAMYYGRLNQVPGSVQGYGNQYYQPINGGASYAPVDGSIF